MWEKTQFQGISQKNYYLLFKSIFSKYDACSLVPEDDKVPILRAQSHQEARAGEGDRSCCQEPGSGDVLVEEVRHDGHQDRWEDEHLDEGGSS